MLDWAYLQKTNHGIFSVYEQFLTARIEFVLFKRDAWAQMQHRFRHCFTSKGIAILVSWLSYCSKRITIIANVIFLCVCLQAVEEVQYSWRICRITLPSSIPTPPTIPTTVTPTIPTTTTPHPCRLFHPQAELHQDLVKGEGAGSP